jgi:hypothetical protein
VILSPDVLIIDDIFIFDNGNGPSSRGAPAPGTPSALLPVFQRRRSLVFPLLDAKTVLDDDSRVKAENIE